MEGFAPKLVVGYLPAGQGGSLSFSSKMGSKQIAQETFDDAVQENILEFEMDPEEAVREAVQQFESQGIVNSSAFTVQVITARGITYLTI